MLFSLKLHRYRPRLLLSAAAGLLVGLLLPDSLRATTRVLVGWDIAAVLYLAFAWLMMTRSNAQAMRQRAEAEDEGALTLLAAGTASSTTS